jgi:hypothetical protein
MTRGRRPDGYCKGRHGRHMLTQANTGWRKNSDGTVSRICLMCHYDSRERDHKRRRAARDLAAQFKPRRRFNADFMLCRKGLHEMTPENIRERGLWQSCKECAKIAHRKRARLVADFRVPCIVKGCERMTTRIHTKREQPYVCPKHRKSPPAEIVSLLRKLGYVRLLSPTARYAA